MAEVVPIKSSAKVHRRCHFCGRELYAIELWCNCPQIRLAMALAMVRGEIPWPKKAAAS